MNTSNERLDERYCIMKHFQKRARELDIKADTFKEHSIEKTALATSSFFMRAVAIEIGELS